MKCREAHSQMALYLGHDLSDRAEWEEVRRHISTCSSCRTHFRKLRSAMNALDQAETESTYEVRSSMWPELRQRINAQPRKRSEGTYNKWLPMASVMVACFAFVAVWFQQPLPPNAPVQHTPKGMYSLDFGTTPSTDRPKVDRSEEKSKEDDEQKKRDVTL